MSNYSNWYQRNKDNPLVSLSDGIFDNLLFLPQSPNRLLGWARFLGFLCLMWFDPLELNLQDTFWIIPYAGFCIVQMIIGIMQMMGIHWGNRDRHFENSTIEETPSIAGRPYGGMNEYPHIQRWFTTRDFYLSNMSSTEQAKFFVETGALTPDSISEMSQHPHTRRALQRLDFELANRTPKEQIEFLRGRNS